MLNIQYGQIRYLTYLPASWYCLVSIVPPSSAVKKEGQMATKDGQRKVRISLDLTPSEYEDLKAMTKVHGITTREALNWARILLKDALSQMEEGRLVGTAADTSGSEFRAYQLLINRFFPSLLP